MENIIVTNNVKRGFPVAGGDIFWGLKGLDLEIPEGMGLICRTIGEGKKAAAFDRDLAMQELSEGKLVIFAGGTSCPYFTTDTTAALRALEIKAQAVVKATKVNGIYTADPVKNPDAEKFDTLTFREALEGRYGVMDSAAFALCADNDLHIVVCNFSEDGALCKVLSGDYSVGTIVH